MQSSANIELKPATKKLSHYQPLHWIQASSSGINNTLLMHKKKELSANLWYCKSSDRVWQELIGNEFCRLIYEKQPKTRLIQPDVGGSSYIASKGLMNFKTFTDCDDVLGWIKSIENGTFTGFGFVVLARTVINNTDLNPGNLGLLGNSIVGIDGGYAFERLKFESAYPTQKLTSSTIAELPFYNSSYMAVSIFDFYFKNYREWKVYLESLQNSPFVKREISMASLRCLLLPSVIINDFVNSYIDDNSDACFTLIKEIKTRLHELQIAMVENSHFLTYLYSRDAEVDCEKYSRYVEEFHTTSKRRLVAVSSIEKSHFIDKLSSLRDFYQQYSLKQHQLLKPQTFDDCLIAIRNHANAYVVNLLTPTPTGDEEENKKLLNIANDNFYQIYDLLSLLELTEEQIHQLIDVAMSVKYPYLSELYYLASEKITGISAQDIDRWPALGELRYFQPAIDAFFEATNESDVLIASINILHFIAKNKFVFKSKLSEFEPLNLDLSCLIEWKVDFYQLKPCHLSDHPEVAQVLYIFGLRAVQSILKNLTPLFIADIANCDFSFLHGQDLKHLNQPYAFKKACLEPQIFPLHSFERSSRSSIQEFRIYVRSVTRRANAELKNKLNGLTGISAIEQFVVSHRLGLAFADLEGDLYKRNVELEYQLVAYLKSLRMNADVDYREYINRFFTDATYEFGWYSILALRAKLTPNFLSNRIGMIKCYFDGGLEFVSLSHDYLAADFFMTELPILSFLLASSPSILSLQKLLQILNYSYVLEKLPNGYLWDKHGISFKSIADVESSKDFPADLREHLYIETIYHSPDIVTYLDIKRILRLFDLMTDAYPKRDDVKKMVVFVKWQLDHHSRVTLRQFIVEHAASTETYIKEFCEHAQNIITQRDGMASSNHAEVRSSFRPA